VTAVIVLVAAALLQAGPGAVAPDAGELAAQVVTHSKSGRLAEALEALSKLDALGDRALDAQFEAHGALHTRYRGRDETAHTAQAAWLVKTSARLPPELRPKHGALIVRAYMTLAEAEADEGHYGRAIQLLKTAQGDWPDLASRLDALLRRYAVIGTDAPPITAQNWVSHQRPSPLDFEGKVTMVQFTAHWCGPCKYSYPAMRRLAQRFGTQGLQTAFFTQLYGYFGALKNLKPDEELAHSRKYYAGLGITFPIAVGAADVESAFKVSGLPQINLIDRHGKIRGVFVGYEPEMEKRLAAQIQALLAEK
jgi:thiol-disulfide isomerase/thioredoxin